MRTEPATEGGGGVAHLRKLPPERGEGARSAAEAARGFLRASFVLLLLDLGYFILSMNNTENLFKIQKIQGFFNQRKKFYLSPSGDKIPVETLTFPTLCFNPDGLEKEGYRTHVRPILNSGVVEDSTAIVDDGTKVTSINAGRRRSRRRFFDLIQCNWEFDCMVTFTVSPEMADRESYKDIISKLNVWLANRVSRHGLKYILVPEYHSDGKAIHFHGFMNREALKLVDSGHKHKGRRVYNVLDYALGFSTCVKLDNMRQYAAWYCYKYITKGDEKIGGRYMLSGGKLRKPIYEYATVDYDEAVGEEWQVADTVRCKIDTQLTF